MYLSVAMDNAHTQLLMDMHNVFISLVLSRVSNGEGEYLTVLYSVIYKPVKYPVTSCKLYHC